MSVLPHYSPHERLILGLGQALTGWAEHQAQRRTAREEAQDCRPRTHVRARRAENLREAAILKLLQQPHQW